MNIVITGANQGIGYFMAEKLLQKGCCVAALDLETDRLQPLKQQYGDRLRALFCDMRDTGQVLAGIGEAARAFGTIDIAVHNACLCTFDPMDNTAEDTYKEVFEVNYFGALRLARAVVPHMREQGGGRVIFTSSGVGVMGFGNISPYASSKGAIEALAKCLSIEYQGTGITFHIIHPPITRTKSSAPLPLPDEFKADPKSVGYGLAEHIQAKSFIICHSFGQKLQTKLCYLFSLKMGMFMSRKLAEAGKGQAQR